MKIKGDFENLLINKMISQKWRFFVAGMIIILRSIILLLPPVIVQKLIDDVLGTNSYGLLWKYCIVLILIPIVSACSIYLDKYFLKSIIKEANVCRVDVFKGLLLNEYSRQKEYDNSSNAFLLCDKMNKLISTLVDGTGNLVWCLFTVVVGVIFCLYQNIPLTIYLLLITLLEGKVVKIIGKYMGRVNEQTLRNSVKRNTFFRNTGAAIKEIKMHGSEDRFISEYTKMIELENNQKKKEQYIKQLTTYVAEMADALVYMGIYVGGALFVINGKCTAGNLVALGSLYDSIFMPIHMLAGMFVNVFSIKNITKRVESIFYQAKERDIIESESVHTIDVKNIYFKYEDVSILENASISIEKGKHTFLVGSSGSGKSTLCDIILGLLKPEAGLVLINNEEANFYKHIRKMQYVSQKPIIISGTIYENIVYGNDDVSKQGVERVLRITKLDTWIRELEHGLNTICENEGFSLSGGEKQRICLARALLSNPDILLLDEALSAVDAKTTEGIIRNLQEECREMGMLFITHNFNLCPWADIIYEMNNQGGIEVKSNGRIEKL